MPIYPFLCEDCGNQFEILSRFFEIPEVSCSQCDSPNTKKQMTVPIVRMGGSRQPSDEYTAKNAPIEHYADKGDFASAAREAERSGMPDFDVQAIRQGEEWRN